MNHQMMRDQLFVWHDGELAGAARHDVEAHLAGCAECRRIVTEWQQEANAFFPAP